MDSLSAYQETLRLLLNPKFHCRIHKSSPLDSILSLLNAVRTPTRVYPKVSGLSR